MKIPSLMLLTGAIFSSGLTFAKNIPQEVEDEYTEGRSPNVDECLTGACAAAVASGLWTQDRPYDAELARRIMSDNRAKALPLSDPKTVQEK